MGKEIRGFRLTCDMCRVSYCEVWKSDDHAYRSGWVFLLHDSIEECGPCFGTWTCPFCVKLVEDTRAFNTRLQEKLAKEMNDE